MNEISFLKRITNILQSKDARANSKTIILTLIILSIWLAIVIYAQTQHEFWRDEVRVLSLVQEAKTPLDLYPLVQYDGHPVLWYLLVYVGNLLINTPLILPILSILIALAAVSIFLFYSPFPFWLRILFIFSALPLYEYSVMARNYGISMLLLFIIAARYASRFHRPYQFALLLFLLANTNIHSVIFVSLICLLWIWDFYRTQPSSSMKQQILHLYLPLMIVAAGIFLCLLFVFPKENTILVQSNSDLTLHRFFKACILYCL